MQGSYDQVGLIISITIYFTQNKFHGREVCDRNSIQVFRSVLCAAICSQDKVIVGTEEGLFAYDLTKEAVLRVDDVKKVFQVQVVPDEQLIVVLSGKILFRTFMIYSYH